MIRAWNADHAARTCERFFFTLLVQITRLYDYQAWQIFYFWEIHKVRKGLWALFLDCAFRMLIGWAGKFRSRGEEWRTNDRKSGIILKFRADEKLTFVFQTLFDVFITSFLDYFPQIPSHCLPSLRIIPALRNFSSSKGNPGEMHCGPIHK